MDVVLIGEPSICANAWERNALTHYSLPHSLGMDPRNLLRRLMERDESNPTQLAATLKRLGKSPTNLQSHLSRWLGNPNHSLAASTAQPLADYYGIDIGAFFDGKIAARVHDELFGRSAQTADSTIVTNDNATVADLHSSIAAQNVPATTNEQALIDALRRVPIDVARDVIQKLSNLYAAPSASSLDATIGRMLDTGKTIKKENARAAPKSRSGRKGHGVGSHSSRSR